MKAYKYTLAVCLFVLCACSTAPSVQRGQDLQNNGLYHEQDWVKMPAGTFLMGASATDEAANDYEKPQHPVQIVQPFKLGRYEVTFAEYQGFAQATHRATIQDSAPPTVDRSRLPAINVSWDDATAYAAWLSKQTGRHFRLPTEAEWEYAARAGTTGKRFWGDNPTDACQFANVFDKRNEAKIRQRFSVPKIFADNYACEDSYFDSAPVGSFKPNPWGLYDMLGNVWEWVQDCRHDHYTGAPTVASSSWQADNGGDCSKRGVRGGSWFVAVPYVCAAYRSWNNPTDKGNGIGFRLVQD
jgi:formylglycine-generating enzyme required for sulfatase activity